MCFSIVETQKQKQKQTKQTNKQNKKKNHKTRILQVSQVWFSEEIGTR